MFVKLTLPRILHEFGKYTLLQVDEDLFLAAYYRGMHQTCTEDECAAFIAQHSTGGKIYSRKDISRAETDLGFTRKRCSVTCDVKLLPVNQMREELFWTADEPVGIANVARRNIGDGDEMGMAIA